MILNLPWLKRASAITSTKISVWYRDRTSTKRPNSCRNLRTFRNSYVLKYDTVLIGNFDIDCLKHSLDRTNYENILSVYKCRRQTSEPTRVTAMSSTCIVHLRTSYQVERKTIKSAISDHHSVSAEIPGIKTLPVSSDPKTINFKNFLKSWERIVLLVSIGPENEKIWSWVW